MNYKEIKNDDYNINRNIEQSKQLVTQLQNNHGVTLKTSEPTTCENSSERPQQPQLAAKSTTTITEQKKLTNLLLTRVRALFLLVDCAYSIVLMEVFLK